jgi:hypothetical protein
MVSRLQDGVQTPGRCPDSRRLNQGWWLEMEGTLEMEVTLEMEGAHLID